MLQAEEVIRESDRPQSNRDVGVVVFPPVFVDEGGDGNCEQERYEWDDPEGIDLRPRREPTRRGAAE